MISSPPFSSLHLVSCWPSHWVTQMDPREQGAKRCTQRRVHSWSIEQGEKWGKWRLSSQWGKSSSYEKWPSLSMAFMCSFAELTGVPHLLGFFLFSDWPLDQMLWRGAPCRSVLFCSHRVFFRKPTNNKLYCLGESHIKIWVSYIFWQVENLAAPNMHSYMGTIC